MQRNPAALASLLITLLLAPGAASADLPFGSSFEGGRLCDWSDGDGVCFTETAMAAGLVGDFPVCVPPSTSAIPGGTMVVCGGSFCASGAEGCDAMAHVTSATFSLASSNATFTATLDDDVFPTQVTFGSSYGCDLNVTAATGAGDFLFTTVPACFVPIVEVATVDLHTIDFNATLSFSNCAIASLLNSFLPGIQPTILAQAEQQVGAILQDGARRLWVGRWVCPAP